MAAEKMMKTLRSKLVAAKPEEQHREYDDRLGGVIELLSLSPLEHLDTFLDVGCGEGEITEWLLQMGKRVTATTLHLGLGSRTAEELARRRGAKIAECSAEAMPFGDGEFDAVVLSHVLEHCPNVQAALREVWRVLKVCGYLFVFVPPHGDRVAGGHVSVGWNVGQLMYVLLLNGFDVRNGSFVQADQNVAAFVRKSSDALPPLHSDHGDIRILSQLNLFPAPISTLDGVNDSFCGKLKCVNWPPYPHKGPATDLRPVLKKGLKSATRLIHPAIRDWLRGRLTSAIEILKDEPTSEKRIELVNPSVLR